jgi:hypothetical protein
MEPEELHRLPDAAAALNAAARSHPDELNLVEVRHRLAEVEDAYEALGGERLRDVVSAALNEASAAAYLAVIQFSGKNRTEWERRLFGDLARHVQQEALQAGVEAANRAEQ